jgi:deazaflavin-dependent oxidoreductase (nitroreductase family)
MRMLHAPAMPAARYIRPSLGTRVFNAVPHALARVGISVYGSRILAVRGRRSGAWRTVPVNLLIEKGVQYLVAPRGETQWVRNLRAAGGGELRLGRRREPFRAVELRDGEKPALLRAYLHRWRFEVAAFFPGVGAEASDAELLRVAPGYPVFRVESG